MDGYIGMSKTASLDFAQPTAAGYFDAVGALEHEISAVMGRVDAVGSAYGAGLYTPLDLFRYSAPGRSCDFAKRANRPISQSMAASRISGIIQRLSDYADWNYSLVRGDAYGAASAGIDPGGDPNDLIEQAVLGYNFTAAGLAAAKLTV